MLPINNFMQADKNFSGVGPAVGLLIPRCTDPTESIRKSSMETIQLLLCICLAVFV